MDKQTQREYARLRARGWSAQYALRDARTNTRFQAYEDAGFARLRVVPDEDPQHALDGDFSPSMLRALRERVYQEGTWGLVVEVRHPLGGDWEHVDSIWGFIGDDWQDSGYDADIKSNAIARLDDFSIGND